MNAARCLFIGIRLPYISMKIIRLLLLLDTYACCISENLLYLKGSNQFFSSEHLT